MWLLYIGIVIICVVAVVQIVRTKGDACPLHRQSRWRIRPWARHLWS